MKNVKVSKTIAATQKTLWAILTDADSYAHWNDSVVRIEGTIGEDQRIKVFAAHTPQRAFALKVSLFDAPRKMVWQSSMPLGLFKGVRTFALTDLGNGRVKFTMQEQFSGLLSGFITKSMPDLNESFKQFAMGLKAVAEG
ncbi:MAG: hypothetical protein ACI9FJ_001668 [Alteromonadaceae bacterium]|jgi:hypothetical protein